MQTKMTKKMIDKLNKWVLIKAIKDAHCDHQLMLLKAINKNDMSKADIELINDIAFGDPGGIDLDKQMLEAIDKEIGHSTDAFIDELLTERLDYAS